MEKRLILAVFCVVPLLLLGCGGEQGGRETSQASTAEPQQPATSVATGEGKPWDPALRPIDMAGADEKCAELHVGVSEKPETVVVNDNGTLQNVFVWVKSGSEGWSFPYARGRCPAGPEGLHVQAEAWTRCEEIGSRP